MRCVAGSEPAGIPLSREAFGRTIRLVTSARLRAAAMAPLADTPSELDDLAEIEGATSSRQIAEDRGLAGLNTEELVHGVPHARFINASFAYAKPREPGRFNPADRGAWYATLDVATCLSEVGFHLTRALADANDYDAVVEYGEMIASMSGIFVDLRTDPRHPALDPDPAAGYPAGNALAARARGEGHNGIIYPSVRHAGGTCIAALWPNVVQSVVQGAMYRLTWNGSPHFTVELL